MEQGSERKFAVFDIDGTVIRWQLYHAIASELAKLGKLSAGAYEQIRDARLTWKQRRHHNSFDTYEQVLVETYMKAVKGLRVADYMVAVEAVFEEYKDQVYIYTRDLIKELKIKGFMLFAISGSQTEIIGKLADYYGFDDFRAADFERADDHFTGVLHTPYGRKLELLQELVTAHKLGYAGSLGIGDSGTDIAILEVVEQPIAFNPNQALFAAAQKHGWPIVVERKNVIYHLSSTDSSYVLST